MWWNLIGCVITGGIAVLVSRPMGAPAAEVVRNYTLGDEPILQRERSWLPLYSLLFGYFIVMLVILLVIQSV